MRLMFCCARGEKTSFDVFVIQIETCWGMIKTDYGWQCEIKVTESSTLSHPLAAVCILHSSVTQQSLSFFCTVLSVRHRVAARKLGQQGAVQSIVKRRARQQDQETQHLQAVKVLPPQRQAHHPDDQRAQAVQHHAGGGTDLFGDTDPSEVEEGDADGVAQQSQQDEGLVADLTEGIDCILQDLTRVVTEAPGGNKIHGDEEQRQDNKPEKTWEDTTFTQVVTAVLTC